MDDKRKLGKFNFFISYYEAAQELPDKQRLMFYDAIMQYVFDDVTPELTGIANTFWGLTMPYLRKSKANTGNGKKGGEANRKANFERNESEHQSEVVSETRSELEANQPANSKRTDKRTPSEIRSEPASETASNKKLEVEVDIEKELPPLTPHGGEGAGDEPTEPEPFEMFWTAYPRKVGKGAARKAWAKVKPGKALVKKILLAVELAKINPDWKRENGRYIPHPTTWLNQGRWEDEPTPEGGATNAGFNPEGMAGFHNALDKYSDDEYEHEPFDNLE